MQRYFSSIYWHFTGSPSKLDWHQVKKPADILALGGCPKSNEDATAILFKILDSKMLRATVTEAVTDNLKTEPFCCVTDIPLKDLPSHAPYYGQVAIGFRAASIHHKFVPVLYISTQQLPIVERNEPHPKLIEMAFDALKDDDCGDRDFNRFMCEAHANRIHVSEIDAKQVQGYLSNFVKITNFDVTPENSFYREREWRYMGSFSFNHEDIAAIVVPENQVKQVRDVVFQKLGYPSTLSIIAWEIIENA